LQNRGETSRPAHLFDDRENWNAESYFLQKPIVVRAKVAMQKGRNIWIFTKPVI
jgi:hypothetical protein